MFKIVVDAFGGDNAPKEIVKGAVMAVNQRSNVHVTLVGKQNEIEALLQQEKYNAEQIAVVHADEVIHNNETPTVAIRQKPNSSLVRSFDIMKENDDYVGIVSAGSTGAVLTGAFLKLGRMKGISRPALCPILPTRTGGVVGIIDVGANMDTKPLHLLHFALMGNEYLKHYYGIEKPRVALLNVGVEEKKGNELTKETFELLQKLPIHFVGNMEARELLSGDVDLVVCDGFAGNVLLKSAEGAILSVLKLLKKEIKSSFSSKFGYLFMKKSFKNLKRTLDYSDQGGAVFLGCKKLLVKSHGSSHASSICASIFQAADMAQKQLLPNIEQALSQVNFEEILPEKE